MSNVNRDYAIVYDVKNSSLALNRPLVFYITDKNTSNIFVKLVTRVIVGDGIDQYTDIENASNYILTMRVIKPNNEVKSLKAAQHEEGSIFQFDLTEDFKDIPGKYICELTISTIVSKRQELITSDPFGYEVKRSILSNVGGIIETEDITAEKLLNILNETKAELIDIRTGANGVVYNNAGDSVRTQVKLLSNDILYNQEEKTTLNLYTTFIRGGLNSGNVITVGNKFRIVSQDIITLSKDVILEVADGFRMGVHTMDNSGTFIADSNWITTNISLKKGTSFRIVIARILSLEDITEIADMAEFTKAVTLKPFNYREDVIGQRTDITGEYFTSNNTMYPNNRIHAKDIVCDDRLEIYLLSTLDYSIYYGIDLYTNDGKKTKISESGWLKPQNNACFVVDQPCIVHISFAKSDNTSFTNLSDINGLVFVHKYRNINKINDKVDELYNSQSQIFNVKGDNFKPVNINGEIIENARLHATMYKCNKGQLLITKLLDKTNYMHAIDLYNIDKKTVISTSGWKVDDITISIENDCYADIILRKNDNSQFDNINEMDGKIEVKKLDEVDAFIFNNANVKENVKHKRLWITTAHRGLVEGVLHENTLGAFYNAYLNGADLIETDARLTADGILIANHNATAVGKDPTTGETVTYVVAETNADVLCSLILSEDDKWGIQRIPTLEQVFNLAYNTGMKVNVDLKNGYAGAEPTAKLVWKCGMRGNVVYALNGSGMNSINKIIELDPDAKFIDRPENFTKEKLSTLEDYEKRCYAYTADFSQSNIDSIRESGCMLATISLTASNFSEAIKHHPEMCEYPHTSDFKSIEEDYFNNLKLY